MALFTGQKGRKLSPVWTAGGQDQGRGAGQVNVGGEYIYAQVPAGEYIYAQYNALLVLDMEMLVHTPGVCLLGSFSCHIYIKPVTSEQTLNVHFAVITYCTFYTKSFKTKNELT